MTGHVPGYEYSLWEVAGNCIVRVTLLYRFLEIQSWAWFLQASGFAILP